MLNQNQHVNLANLNQRPLYAPDNSPRQRVQRIRETTPLQNVIDTPLKKVSGTGGGEYAGPCPLCGGVDRFHVQPSKNRWFCRHCSDGKWQDVVDFVQRRDNLTFLEALDYLENNPYRSDRRPRPALPMAEAAESDPTPAANWLEAVNQLDLPHARKIGPIFDYLLSQGYLDTTLEKRGVLANLDWLQTAFIKPDGKPAKLPPGVVYAHRGPAGEITGLHIRLPHQKDGKPDGLAHRLKVKPSGDKYIWLAGSKPKAGVYGNLDTPDTPVIITAGEKDSDLVYQTFPGPVNSITAGSMGEKLPAWVVQKIAALAAPFVLVMFDNDPPQEQQAAEKLAVELRAVLPCPVLVIPPPKGFKDFADFVIADEGVGKFWAGIVAPLPTALIELLCGFKRFEWVAIEHGDPAYLAAVLLVRREAIAQGLISYTAALSISQLVTLSEMVGQPLTDRAARAGVTLAVKFGVWENLNLAEFGYSIREGDIYVSNLGKVGNNTALYKPLSSFVGLKNLLDHLENEIPTTYNDWADGEFLEELHRYNIPDTHASTLIDRVDLDGTPYQDVINETAQLLDQLAFLSDAAALVSLPQFEFPDGFTLASWPGQKENTRPNASKGLRVALLRILNDQNAREFKFDDMTLTGWQASALTLARTLGIAESSVSDYRRAAGLTTHELKPKTTLVGDGNRRAQLEKIIGKRQGGVTVWIGAAPNYITPANRDKVLEAAVNSPYGVAVEIQLPSVQYAAAPDEIEAVRLQRSERHKARVERAQKEKCDDPLVPKSTPSPKPAPPPSDTPQIAEEGYSWAFIRYHLLKMLPALLEAAKTSVLIAQVLSDYGLMKGGETMPFVDHTAPKYEPCDDGEAQTITPPPAPPKPAPSTKPMAQPAPRRVNHPADYPFANEYQRLNRPEYQSQFRQGA